MSATSAIEKVELFPEGSAPPSPAEPLPEDVSRAILPPAYRLPRLLESPRFNVRQMDFMLRARRELGETFRLRMTAFGKLTIVVSHPDHVRSLFQAPPDLAPSMAASSPLRPIVGPNSLFVVSGSRHLHQRKLLLPSFHGEAMRRYVEIITDVVARDIDDWPIGRPFPLAPRLQSITLDVIMAGIFGIHGRPARGTPEHGLRRAVRWAVSFSALAVAQFAELLCRGRDEAIGPVRAMLSYMDRQVYAVIAARRAAQTGEPGTDILGQLLEARTEDGEPLSDQMLRDELLTLVLVGHETTANGLAWILERILHTPHAYERLRETMRAQSDPDGYLEATINEGLRVRPVVPTITRQVKVPWRFGDHSVPAGATVLTSILLLHHREDIYPEPFAFLPERFVGRKPGAFTWIPFSGGVRRCLGSALAMAELRGVLEAVARRTDLRAVNTGAERPKHRNVTMVPACGTPVIVTSRRPA